MRGNVGMLFQKCLKKIIVFPVIIVNIVCLLLVKILVSVYRIAHGVAWLFILCFCIAEIVIYRDILQSCMLGAIGFFSFIILSAGTFVEAVLERIIATLWRA